MYRALFAAGIACVFASATQAQTPPEGGWGAATAADAQAFHDALEDGHPGPHDAENPGFQALLDRGLAHALERARSVDSYGGYVWTLREYAASFDDGHVGLVISSNSTLPTRWPGFVVRYAPAGYVVSGRDAAFAAAPPIGARLVSCDGVAADQLAADRVGRTRGRWMMESARIFNAWRLFVDQGDPFAPSMRRCRFDSGGRIRTYTLNWAPVEDEALAPYRTESQARTQAGIAIRPYGDNGYWIALGSFDGSPGSEDARQLTALMAELERSQDELRVADVIVLDLRGNNGGSSSWSYTVADAIWGEEQVGARTQSSQYVDWRVSDATIAYLTSLREQWAADANAPPGGLEWVTPIVAGMIEARAQNQVFWREQDDPDQAPLPIPGPLPARPHVVVIADAGCASACLDALDVWRTMGAVQVGVTTSGDTVYMDVRRQALPSGQMDAFIPMKVYRGRLRGNNEPYAPHHVFTGDLTDTQALEAWIATLPELQTP